MKELIKPRRLRKGDKVAIVSLSSGMLGEDFCEHYIELGTRRLREFDLETVFMPNSLKGMDYLEKNPKARADDLVEAFFDDSISGIICAIGGNDTYKLLPYLMEDAIFGEQVIKTPKIFTGFSDTTINHLMFYKLGMRSYYGPSYINDICEMGDEMLDYTKRAFSGFIEGNEYNEIVPSKIWYEERSVFSPDQRGVDRVSHEEKRGFELLQGGDDFEGRLIGGCVESLCDLIDETNDNGEAEIAKQYGIFPSNDEFKDKVLFIETSEEKPDEATFSRYVEMLNDSGIIDAVSGIIVGKPQNNEYYDEYKQILTKIIDREKSILYNVNFGHAFPRCVLPYGIKCRVSANAQKIEFLEDAFEKQKD